MKEKQEAVLWSTKFHNCHHCIQNAVKVNNALKVNMLPACSFLLTGPARWPRLYSPGAQGFVEHLKKKKSALAYLTFSLCALSGISPCWCSRGRLHLPCVVATRWSSSRPSRPHSRHSTWGHWSRRWGETLGPIGGRGGGDCSWKCQHTNIQSEQRYWTSFYRHPFFCGEKRTNIFFNIKVKKRKWHWAKTARQGTQSLWDIFFDLFRFTCSPLVNLVLDSFRRMEKVPVLSD